MACLSGSITTTNTNISNKEREVAFFVNHYIECDGCNASITIRASSKQDANRRLINPNERWEEDLKRQSKWFADGNEHYCCGCKHPYIQDENGDNINQQ